MFINLRISEGQKMIDLITHAPLHTALISSPLRRIVLSLKPLTTRVYTFSNLIEGGFLYVDKTNVGL
jgi:hypothetical protein